MSQSRDLSKIDLPADQDWLIDRMRKLGYRSNEGGICFGVALMWTQALLADDLNTFNQRLYILYSRSANEWRAMQNRHKQVVERIRSVLEDLKKKARLDALKELNLENKILTIAEIKQLNLVIQEKNKKIEDIRTSLLSTKENEEESLLADAQAFFEGVQVYLQGHQYHADLFNIDDGKIPLAQDALRVSKIILSKKLEKSKDKKIDGVAEIGKDWEFSRPYNEKDLIAYFEKLRRILEKGNISYPVSLVLGGGGHTISVAYNPQNKSWLLIDANKLPMREIASEKSIAKSVLCALSDDEHAVNAVFSTEVFVAARYQQDLIPHITAWHNEINTANLYEPKGSERAKLVDSNGTSLLYVAAGKGHIGLVRTLLDSKVIDPNLQRCNDGRTALHIATREGRLDIVNMLLETKEIELNKGDSFGETPLHIAARQGRRADIMKSLLRALEEKGISPNMGDENGETPLQVAVRQSDLQSVKLLLETKGIDPNKKRKDSKTALHIAVFQGALDMVSMLLAAEGIELNIPDEDGETPLYYAARLGYSEIVKKILKSLEEKGISPNTQRKDGETPLYIAARQGHLGLLKLLLYVENIDPNIKRKDGKTALHIAALQGRLEVVKTLLQAKKINPNIADNEGNTALHIAVRSGNIDLVEMLLAFTKLDPDQANEDGESPLKMAIRQGSMSILQRLLDKAKPNLIALRLVMNWHMQMSQSPKSKQEEDSMKISLPFGMITKSSMNPGKSVISSIFNFHQAGIVKERRVVIEKRLRQTQESCAKESKLTESNISVPKLIMG